MHRIGCGEADFASLSFGTWPEKAQPLLCCRETGFSEADAIAAGEDAGYELKKLAGPEFFQWSK